MKKLREAELLQLFKFSGTLKNPSTNKMDAEILHALILANVQSNQKYIHQRKPGGVQNFCIIMCSNRHGVPTKKKRVQKFFVSMSSEVHSHSIYKYNGAEILHALILVNVQSKPR